MTYEAIRQFADSYGLAAMVIAYLLFAAWAFRPGARRHHDAAARMIFGDDGGPADSNGDSSHGR